MNTKTITTWIAQHRVRAVLIALGVVLLAWDWFAIPRLIIMMILPFTLLLLPLLLIAAPIAIIVIVFRRRAAARAATEDYTPAMPQQAGPQALPPRRPTEQELMDLYERYPERFEGVDLGDEIDR